MFEAIAQNIKIKHRIYYQNKLNKEYGCYSHILNKYVFLDFYDLIKNKGIEFYGDYWHCNPKFYTEKFIHPHLKIQAKEIWTRDRLRNTALKIEFGINILVIWEHDYKENPTETIKKCKEFMNYGL